MRTLAVLAALLLAGLALARLTGSAPATVSPPPQTAEETPIARGASFELLLSAPAKRVRLEAGGQPVTMENPVGPLTGKLELSGEAPVIFLQVEWAEAPAAHRFAKLRLESPGEETREHVFSAAGDIDDLWEP